MSMDRMYLVWAMGYAVAGMVLGLIMAASHNNAQADTHSHILLVGFVASFIYGVVHKLWIGNGGGMVLSWVQFITHQVGAAVLFVGLLLKYASVFQESQLEPVLAISSLLVLSGAVLMLVMAIKARKA